MPTFALNFSRPGAQVLLQYFQFLRLGRDGYRRIQQTCQDVAVHLSDTIAAMPEFELVSDGRDLPVFAFRMADGITKYDGVRLVAEAARAGLAGAGVHDAAEPGGPGRTAGGRA